MSSRPPRAVLAGCLLLFAAFPPPLLAETTSRSKILEEIELPLPATDGGMSLNSALKLRHSERDYAANRPLAIDQIGQLLWSAQGLNRPDRRTAPSAGALYPLEIYAVTRKGIFHYRPAGHRALVAWQAGLIDSLFVAAHANKDAIRRAPAVFVIAGVMSRTEAKYGRRAERYVTLEAGHAAQNLLLQATALALRAVPIGSYDDAAVSRVLALPEDQTPLYLIPVGHPPDR